MAEIHSPLEVVADLSAVSANMTSEQCSGSSDLGVNVGGLIAIIVFYVAVLLVSCYHYETYSYVNEQNNAKLRLESGQAGRQEIRKRTQSR